jgi:hypothetical protein
VGRGSFLNDDNCCKKINALEEAHVRLCQDAMIRSFAHVRSRDNSRILESSRSLASTYVLSRDLKNLAGLVFAVEGWRRYRPSSPVNALDCISKDESLKNARTTPCFASLSSFD